MKPDWWSCNGRGDAHTNERRVSELRSHDARLPTGDSDFRSHDSRLTTHDSAAVSRRRVLLGAGLAAVAWAARSATALADVAVTRGQREPQGDVLVTLFLRGGADGLNIVVPHAEDGYHRLRPSIGLAAPKDYKAPLKERVIDLDGFFGLHPSMAALAPLFHEGRLAAVHACGSMDQTRSHFEAMATMERGLGNNATGTASGWIARHLSATQGANLSPLRAVALSSVMPDSLRGATDATAVSSLADFRLYLPDGHGDAPVDDLHQALKEFYGSGNDAIAHAGRETLAVLDTLNRIDPAHYKPANGAAYPNTEVGNGFKQVACLIKGRVGLEVACLDRGGWDTHVAQGSTAGLLAPQLEDISRSIAAFSQDLGAEMKCVTMVVMTEFGRRAYENQGLGTDHGRGSVMLLAGGGVVGGKVHARWPGLEEHQLEQPGDLKVTTDYRDVLAEILSKRVHNHNLAAVFPDYAPRPAGVVA